VEKVDTGVTTKIHNTSNNLQTEWGNTGMLLWWRSLVFVVVVMPIIISTMIQASQRRLRNRSSYFVYGFVSSHHPRCAVLFGTAKPSPTAAATFGHYDKRRMTTTTITTAATVMIMPVRPLYGHHSLIPPSYRSRCIRSNDPRHRRSQQTTRLMSVSGIIYEAMKSNETMTASTAITTGNQEEEMDNNIIVVTLFTKENCSLCDTVVEILQSSRTQFPHHTLVAVDITDPLYHDIWYERYKYDIPVLHINDRYWTKHRVTIEQVEYAFREVQQHPNRTFTPIGMEPNAAASIRVRPKGTTTTDMNKS
jgi:Glutaredoxin-like domain (DUF836)